MDRPSPGLDNRFRLAVFITALAVRLVYLFQSLDNPVFFTPLVDAGTYHDLALRFAQQGWIGEGFFWQPFLYPFFLGIVYLLTGGSILAAKLVQMGLGILTCVLTYELGRRIAGRAAGFAAALIVSFYGPLLVFESELVGAGPAAFMSVLLLLLFLKTGKRPKKKGFFVLGIISAAAVLIRPTFFPFAVLALLWLLWGMLRNRQAVPGILVRAGIWAGGFLFLALPVVLMNAQTAEGRWSFMPYSGAVNFYVGNNPDICRTLTVRPGWEWERLLDMPRFHGIESPSGHPGFFRARAAEYAAAQPVGFMKNLGRKSLRLISSREIPRNVDVYTYRNWSGLLRFLMGKSGSFGWPFGLVFPFAVLAAVAAFRKLPPVIWLFLAVHSLSLVMVFPAARYRIEMIPVLAAAASVGWLELFRRIREKRPRAVFGLILLLGLSTAAAVLPGPFCEESMPYEAELNKFLAIHHLEKGHVLQAQDRLRRAARLEPEMSGIYVVWGDLMGRENRFNEAYLRYQQAVHLNPERDDAFRKMGTVAFLAGQYPEAEKLLERSLEINPYSGKGRVILGRLLEKSGREPAALQQYRTALEAKTKIDKGDKAEALMRVSMLSWGREPAEETADRLQDAYLMDPSKPETLMSLAWLRAVFPQNEVRDTPNAVNMAWEAWRIKPKDAFTLDVLGASLAEAGEYDQAEEAVKQALALAEAHPDALPLQQELTLRLDAYMSGNPWRSRRPPSWYRYSR